MCVAMKTLDGDDVRLSAKGRYAERDIVQVDSTNHGYHDNCISLIVSSDAWR